MKHPLLNPQSKHYDTGNKASIYDFEKTKTPLEMDSVCDFEIFKYKRRLGKKAQFGTTMEAIKQSDLKKIETWENYKKLLSTLTNRTSSTRYAIDAQYPNMEYSL